MSNTATPAQIQFINRLKTDRDVSGEKAQVALEFARLAWTDQRFTVAEASSLIDLLLQQPQARTATRMVDGPPEGMHLLFGAVYKVQESPETGRRYAKVLLQDADTEQWGFHFAPGAVRRLSAATLMALDEAKHFGRLYGTCCVCGRTLTNEESIEAGIGPVCSGRFA
jgi:hypothetical protein